MTTVLDKLLKRQLSIRGRDYILTVSPEGLKVTLKGHRKGVELSWEDLITGQAALATALNASLGRFETAPKSGETSKSRSGSRSASRSRAPSDRDREQASRGRSPAKAKSRSTKRRKLSST